MKEAGIISLDKNRKYQLDRRGIYLAAGYKYFEETGIETIIKLKTKLYTVKHAPLLHQ